MITLWASLNRTIAGLVHNPVVLTGQLRDHIQAVLEAHVHAPGMHCRRNPGAVC